MEDKSIKSEAIDWWMKTTMIAGHFGLVVTGLVCYLYYQGGYVQVQKPIEVIEAQCKQMSEMKVMALSSLKKGK